MDSDSPPTQATPRQRIEAIDLARGIALLAMVVYHFTWDLEFFGYASQGLTAEGGWRLFARCIASSFLFLVGVSLVLAHGRQIRWRGFWLRFAMILASAAAITAGTWFFIGVPGFIFFGILHQIAFASLAGLLFLRLPALLTLVLAACVIAAPLFLRSEFFDHPAFWWVGLSSADPRSNDYVPVFPWFGAVLAGIGVAGIAFQYGLFARLAEIRLGRWSAPIRFFGRHSLAFYLIHQPLLIGGLWLASQILPPPPASPESFKRACVAQCTGPYDTAFCTRYCDCFYDELVSKGVSEAVLANRVTPEVEAMIPEIASFCTIETEGGQ
jgi:uncharacterized membrane protein